MKEYGSMRAIGMSNRQLIKMIIAEAGTSRNKRSDLGLYHWTSYALGYLCKSYNKYLGNSMECSVYSPYTHNRYCTVDFSFGS